MRFDEMEVCGDGKFAWDWDMGSVEFFLTVWSFVEFAIPGVIFFLLF